MKKLVAEFIGTFFLVLIVGLTGNPLAIGAVLMVMVYALGPISGGHFNPAVTIAAAVFSSKSKIEIVLQYIIVQFLGGIAASIVIYFVTQHYFLTGIPSGSNFISAFLIETLFTFALVFVIFNVAVSEKTKNNQYFGIAIGFTLFVIATAGGTISGGAFNPAVGVAPLLVNFQNIGSNITNIILYIAGPVLGGILAAAVFKFIDESK